MNHHYFDLKLYLQEAEQHPEVVMNDVFVSEIRLYGLDKKVNHCLHGNSDGHILYPVIVSGVAKMREKLCL